MDSVETERHPLLRLEARAVGRGLVGGFLGGIAMGVVLQFGTELIPVLGALVGQTSVLRGWVVHLSISLLYGVLFTVVVAYPPVQDFVSSFGFTQYVFAGVTYAALIAAVSISVLPFVFELPWAASVEGSPLASGGAPSLWGLVPAGLFAVGHVVYGAVLGAVYTVTNPDS